VVDTAGVLVRPEGEDAVLCIGQPAHAWVSGQIAQAWAGEVPHRPAVELAAAQHDVGMAAWDLAPALDPGTGWPVGFMRMELDEHLRLWSLAPQRLFTQSRVAALAVSLHGTKLYERRDLDRLEPAQADAVRAYLAGQRALQERLMHETGVTPDEAAEMQRLLFAWDWLSLGLCLGWAPSDFGADPRMRLTAGTVAPWPFAADAVTFVTEGRRLTERATSAPELHALLERAERVALRYSLTRAPSGAP
jgi:hypothetical protein